MKSQKVLTKVKKQTPMFGTQPEKVVRTILTELGRKFKTNEDLGEAGLEVKESQGSVQKLVGRNPDGSAQVVVEQKFKIWNFRPDILDETNQLESPFVGPKIIVEVRGFHYFRKPKVRRISAWKDKIYRENGYRVISVSYELTKRVRNREKLKARIALALVSTNWSEIIHDL